VTLQRHSISSVTTRLGLNYHTLRQWVHAAGADAIGAAGGAGRGIEISPEQRIRELEKENARLRMERDILKKATVYFAAMDGGRNP
jgi:transposase